MRHDAGKSAETEAAAVLASRIAADLAGGAANAAFAHYAVPAMSDVQRLPDVYPADGRAGGTVRIIAARGEYEPGAFLVYPFSDLGKVAFTLSPFRTYDGRTFPAENLDLKLVKAWYQNGNGWYSYFGDTGFKLVPELLVNDEEIIRADPAAQANYARLKDHDGTVHEQWINPPRKMDRRHFDHYRQVDNFMPMKETFRDAETLQPVALHEGSIKSFFLTAHVTTNVPPGTYQGAVRLAAADGKSLGDIPVALTVLPFELPSPKTYFDPGKDFLVSSYSYITLGFIMEQNGGDSTLARRQMEAILRDQVAHNHNIHWMYWVGFNGKRAEIDWTLDAMKRAGMRTDIVLVGNIAPRGSNAEKRAHARSAARWFDDKLGHHNVYIGFGDEPNAAWCVEARPTFEIYQKEGFKFIIAGGEQVFHKVGYLYDWHNSPQDAAVDTTPKLWNQLHHAHVANYAQQHVGVENPAYNRRQYGMASYLSGYSAVCNYAHHLGPYNDDRTGYRPMVFAYGIHGGVLDTLQWEGFREGIDDIRYATLLMRLADDATRSPEVGVQQEGRLAMQYFAGLPRESANLDTCRLEMIDRILHLRKLLGHARADEGETP